MCHTTILDIEIGWIDYIYFFRQKTLLEIKLVRYTRKSVEEGIGFISNKYFYCLEDWHENSYFLQPFHFRSYFILKSKRALYLLYPPGCLFQKSLFQRQTWLDDCCFKFLNLRSMSIFFWGLAENLISEILFLREINEYDIWCSDDLD